MQQQTEQQKTKTKTYDSLLFFVFFGLLLHIALKRLSEAMYNLMMATTMAETCSC